MTIPGASELRRLVAEAEQPDEALAECTCSEENESCARTESVKKRQDAKRALAALAPSIALALASYQEALGVAGAALTLIRRTALLNEGDTFYADAASAALSRLSALEPLGSRGAEPQG